MKRRNWQIPGLMRFRSEEFIYEYTNDTCACVRACVVDLLCQV